MSDAQLAPEVAEAGRAAFAAHMDMAVTMLAEKTLEAVDAAVAAGVDKAGGRTEINCNGASTQMGFTPYVRKRASQGFGFGLPRYSA